MATFRNDLRPREDNQRAVDQGPIFCAAPGCPLYGTMTTSTTHDRTRDVRWYCRHHWELKDDPKAMQQLSGELRRNHVEDWTHWSDAEVEKRNPMVNIDSRADAKHFLDLMRASLGRAPRKAEDDE
jgi:hypothetical protein